ncbi:MAG TPA: trigger factor [Candidatus Izemoplasmatales bacterium]|nr:trigger factor [Candidatus Izemoplasmatales bacterium]
MMIDKLSGSRVHFTITVTGEMFEHALDHAFEVVNEKTEIKGFRKGKAPRSVYEAHYGIESLYEEAVEHAIGDTYYDAITENDIDVVAQPKIDFDFKNVKRGSDFTYEVTVAVRPEVVLGEYLGTEVKLLPDVASDVEIDTEITREREKNAEMVLKEEGVLEEGDTAVFDFEGSVDGVKFDGGSAENYELVIGSNQFIPGFEEQMKGMAPETEKNVIVSFPEDYHEKSLAGKESVFKVTLHEIKNRVVPQLDDEFVKDLNLDNISTIDEYKAYVKNQIETDKKKQNENQIRTTVIEKATENATFDLPEEMIEEEVKRADEDNQNRMKQYRLDFDTYLKYMGKTKEEYLTELKEEATKTLRQQMVINAIAKKENLEADDKETEAKYQEIADQYKSQNITLDQVKNAIPVSAIKEEISFKKAIDLLIEKANVIR